MNAIGSKKKRGQGNGESEWGSVKYDSCDTFY